MPKISIIITVYNKEKYLKQSLESVINQSLKDIEIICIDDGSADSSPEILKEYANKDARIKIITNKREGNNFGAGYCRNLGLKECTSDYITFLDSDDWLNLDALESFYNKTLEGDFDIIVANSNNFIEDKNEYKARPYSLNIRLLNNHTEFSYKDIPRYIFNFTTPDVWGKLFKKSFISENNIEFLNLKCCNDVYFMHKTLLYANKITYIENVVVFWRVNNSTSITSKRYKHSDCWIKNFNKIKQDIIERNCYDLLEDSLLEAYVNLAKYEISHCKGFYIILFIFNIFKHFSCQDMKIFLEKLVSKKVRATLVLLKYYAIII